LGNNIEGTPQQVQNVQQCSTQNFYENRTVGFNVVYEYGGRQYTVQMPSDPGPTVQLQVTPVGAVGATAPLAAAAPLGVAQPMTYVQPDVAPMVANTTTYVMPAYTPYPTTYVTPSVVYGGSYYRPYYPPVGVSLNFGYRGGYYHGGRHWR
jgi:hypothetical protein